MASIVTMQAVSANVAKSSGIAVFSVDFSAVARCPRTRPAPAANALTKCSDVAFSVPDRWLVLPSSEQLTFIDVIRARSVVLRMGAELATGLSGDVSTPRIASHGSTVRLTNEGAAIAEGQAVIGQIGMTPKHVGAYTELSRLLNVEAPPSDAVIFASLANSIAVAVTRVALRNGFFGAWDNLLIGEWGQLQVAASTFSDFQAGVL